jgi:ABC-type Fe3+/spermidine/putrescine transport system ATPase subunit
MEVILKNIIQKYGDFTAVNNLSLTVEKGELLSLIGPSGCGKTTLLRTIAGLIPLTSGKISINDKDISEVPPQKRNTALVFQNYALFPHMTVYENVEYGLKIKKIDKKTRMEKVHAILEKVQLESLSNRRIDELSGGQQQRVALARALIIEPNVLLFDEPLSNLDEKLRTEMRKEIKKIQKDFGITSIYVTHDQQEAFSISDRIAVMNKGIIEQLGTPNEIYYTPKNQFVAEFMGNSNIIELSQLKKDSSNNFFLLNKEIKIPSKYAENTSQKILIRPEMFKIEKSGKSEGKIKWIENLGGISRLTVETSIGDIIIESTTNYGFDKEYSIGSTIKFDFDDRFFHFF